MSTRHKTSIGCDKRNQKYLVLLTARGSKMVGIHNPTGNRVSIGRSSRNHIRVNDPHFPRLAGEVILRPAPLIRMPDTGSGDNRVQRITPGKPIRLPPYHLHLLEEGDIIRNSQWWKQKDRSGKKYTGWKVLLPITISVVGLCFLSPAVDLDNEKSPSEISASFNISRFIEEDLRRGEMVLKTRTKEQEKRPIIKKTAPLAEPPKTITARVDDEVLSEEIFTKNLDSASLHIAKGDWYSAGRCIHSIQAFLTKKQRERLIGALEPVAEKMYRKAYILRSFDSRESDRIFYNLSRSELEILPSVVKAGRMRSRK